MFCVVVIVAVVVVVVVVLSHLKTRLEPRSDEADFVPGVQRHLSVIIIVAVSIGVDNNSKDKKG